MTLMINIGGLVLIGLIVWWFWMPRTASSKQAAVSSEVTVIVDKGVYEPALIHARAGQPLTLHFDRRDPSPCAEQVVFHGLAVSECLDNGKITSLTLQDLPQGEYRFTCQMQMYQGRLIVD